MQLVFLCELSCAMKGEGDRHNNYFQPFRLPLAMHLFLKKSYEKVQLQSR
jgi:hypothetical protein